MKIDYKLHPFFEDSPPPVRRCDQAGCHKAGEYRAPVSPSRLREYYWFCLEHVREYNMNWDFDKRLSQEEIERSRTEDATWQRPTWRFGRRHSYTYYTRFQDHFSFFHQGRHQYNDSASGYDCDHARRFPPYSEEAQALKILELNHSIDPETLKKRYKELAKKYHPDLNQGCLVAQETFKKINQAYLLLKKVIG
jgi:DnaJ-domain-containing protein 1